MWNYVPAAFILPLVNFKLSVPLSDWLGFFLFLSANTLLALGPFSLEAKLWIGGVTLGALALLPSGLAGHRKRSADPFGRRESKSGFPPWLGMTFIGVGLFFRFYKLTTLSTWPTPDEGVSASIALHISRHWDWRFFYTSSQITFPYPWGWAVLIKFFGLSALSLWLIPAVLSALAVPLFYLALRRFFPRDFSLLATALGALAFWGLYLPRIQTCNTLVEPVELLTLFLLGNFLADKPDRPQRNIFLLALSTALGFYVYPPAWLPLALILFAVAWSRLKKHGPAFFLFIAAFSVAFLPFAFFALREHYGSYIRTLQLGGGLPDIRQFVSSVSYVTGLFWGNAEGAYYGPYWGGLFDPLTAALFFTGVRFAWRDRRNPAWKWVAAAVFLALVPGIFSANLEFCRIFLVFPFIVFLAAFGCLNLGETLKSGSRRWFFSGILAVAAVLNLYHLLGPYQQFWKDPGPAWSYYKSPENARAFRILEQAGRELGPGYIFQNFPSDMSDPSLALAVYPFNMADNPGIRSSPARWFAFLVNDNYKPFLLRRFPGGRWFPLSTDLNRTDGGLGLGIFPIGSLPAGTLNAWLKANDAFGETAYAFLNRPTGTDYSLPLGSLKSCHPLMAGDPLLESCYWEKLYYLYLQNQRFGDKETSANLASSVDALQSALQSGYPAAHLYNELGSYFFLEGKYPQAGAIFQKALKANPDFNTARENLARVRQSIAGR